MVLYKAVQQYKRHLVTVPVFLLLGIFAAVLAFFSNIFLTSGAFFLEYQFLGASLLETLIQIVLVLAYLGVFSVFLSVIIFAVRQDMAKVHFDTYLQEKIPKFALEIFEFLAALSIVVFVVSLLLISVGVPPVVMSLIWLVVFALTFYVPQSIVVDEVGWQEGISQSIHSLFSFAGTAFFTIAVGVVIMAILPIVELWFDQFAFLGRYVTLLLLLIVILPFLEMLKTVTYLTKFELIKTWM